MWACRGDVDSQTSDHWHSDSGLKGYLHYAKLKPFEPKMEAPKFDEKEAKTIGIFVNVYRFSHALSFCPIY